MCGICGKVSVEGIQRSDLQVIRNMMETIKYRGPDDEGIYSSDSVALGHRRLSIIDLNTGKQPISNEDGTIWVIFNGEIYNFASLKKDLLKHGHFFKTSTDTEVLVHGYEEYGIELLSKLRGMFAFAIWDQNQETLLLVRDRVGIKPLYYTSFDNCLLFASEIKAILQDPCVKPDVNLSCIDRFLTYYYLPGSDTLLKNIFKLLPGHYLIWKDGQVITKKYWDLEFIESEDSRSIHESVVQLRELLRETVRLHMISDVPVGFLLSGGVDSTALLSLAIQETNKDISTFTVGFSGEGFADERRYARLAADAFGTKQYDLTITSRDFGKFLPKYVWHMEEPVCEPPAVALYYVSKLASEHVKVLISGEGGDEAFAGYPNYRNYVWLERLKRGLGSFRGLGSYLVKTLSHAPGLQRIGKFSPLMTIPFEDYYLSRTSTPFTFFNKSCLSIYTKDFLSSLNKNYSIEPTALLIKNALVDDVLGKMLYVDTKSWLPDDLLIKADKMTMANSVELRVPLLDHKVLEFAANLPSSYKLHGFTTKYILKTAFRKLVPTAILDRKKTGFPVPYDTWMRRDLRDLVEDTLLSQKALNRGYFNRHGLEKVLSANLNGKNYSKEIFSLLTLELWHREFIDGISVF
jgi:asparagine synthase (glutamine-hydrolysing)